MVNIMRLWSIEFEYLDNKGLVAVWREALLAKKVLEGHTKGYKMHPQLFRFKSYENPLIAINTYLYYITLESSKRGYAFDNSKIIYDLVDQKVKLKVTSGQLNYEFKLLERKLKDRSPSEYVRILKVGKPLPNQLFYEVPGNIEKWEKVKPLYDE